MGPLRPGLDKHHNAEERPEIPIGAARGPIGGRRRGDQGLGSGDRVRAPAESNPMTKDQTSLSAAADHAVPSDRDGFFEYIGGSYVDVTPDRVEGALVVETRHLQPYGVVNGGVYCAIVESLGSMGGAAWGSTQDGIFGVVGVANNTDFIRSHRSGSLRGVATPIHRGRTQQLWQVVVTRDSDGKAVARGQIRLQNIADPTVIGGMGTEGRS